MKKEKAGPAMSDEAVKAKTGKAWNEWFKLLDAGGGKKMDHKQIVAQLRSKHEVGDWWVQMVAVGYEQARGLRQLHQKAACSAADFQVALLTGCATPLSEHLPGAPEDLAELFTRALSLDRAARYGSAAELLGALERALRSSSGAAG